MKILTVVLLGVAMAGTSDPGHCQRVIKYMLIQACGETKRENHLDSMQLMSDSEVERRYTQMVRDNVVRGLRPEEEALASNKQLDTNKLDETDVEMDEPLLRVVQRRMRSRRAVIPLTWHVSDPHTHEKRGSFHFIDGILPSSVDHTPVPHSLKVQCCAPRICSMDDFRAFCEVD